MGRRAEVRAFWKRLGLFLILPLVAAVAMEIRLSHFPNSFLRKDQALRRHADTIQLLILGSSHTMNGIRPDQFSVPAFNMGNSSQSIVLDERILERYLPMLPHLKTVLVCISYFSLDYLIVDSREAWRESFYRRFYHVGESELSRTILWRPRDLSLFYMYGQRAAREALFGAEVDNQLGGLNEDGWWGVSTRMNGSDVDASSTDRVDYFETILDARRRPRNIAALERLIAVARARGVEVVFVTLPVHESFARKMNRARWDAVQEIMQTFCRREQLRYLNHFQNPPFPLVDFVNTDHLNDQGAYELSRLVNRELNEKKSPSD